MLELWNRLVNQSVTTRDDEADSYEGLLMRVSRYTSIYPRAQIESLLQHLRGWNIATHLKILTMQICAGETAGKNLSESNTGLSAMNAMVHGRLSR